MLLCSIHNEKDGRQGGLGEDNEIPSSLPVFLFPKEPVLLFVDLLLFNTSTPLNLLDI